MDSIYQLNEFEKKNNLKIDERNTTAPISYNAEIAIMDITESDSSFYWRKSNCQLTFSLAKWHLPTSSTWTAWTLFERFCLVLSLRMRLCDDEKVCDCCTHLAFQMVKIQFEHQHFLISIHSSQCFDFFGRFLLWKCWERERNKKTIGFQPTSEYTSFQVLRFVSLLFLYDFSPTHRTICLHLHTTELRFSS